MASNELDEFLNKSHKDLSVEDFEGKKTPCIGFEGRKFEKLLSYCGPNGFIGDTNLNILYNPHAHAAGGSNHVFVQFKINFKSRYNIFKGNFIEKILIHANENMDFFTALASSRMYAISSIYDREKLIMIQLPKPEKIISALEIIHEKIGYDYRTEEKLFKDVNEESEKYR